MTQKEQEQEVFFCVKPGQNKSKNNNRQFKYKEQKNYKRNRNKNQYKECIYGLVQENWNETEKQEYARYKSSGFQEFNFKKCSANKYIYGTGVYIFIRQRDTFDKKLAHQRNTNKKQNQKLRNKICMNYQSL